MMKINPAYLSWGMAVQCFMASAAYAYNKQWPHAVYWFLAGAITISVIYL